MKTEKLCLDCEESIIGRADKKFCSDQCRSNYFNRQNSDKNKFMRNVNNILRKNRRILEALNPEGKKNIHKDKLSASGFDFNYHTHTYKTRKGDVYIFCYEQGYLPLEKDFYMLVRRDI